MAEARQLASEELLATDSPILIGHGGIGNHRCEEPPPSIAGRDAQASRLRFFRTRRVFSHRVRDVQQLSCKGSVIAEEPSDRLVDLFRLSNKVAIVDAGQDSGVGA
jgi:hypothetical protein